MRLIILIATLVVSSCQDIVTSSGATSSTLKPTTPVVGSSDVSISTLPATTAASTAASNRPTHPGTSAVHSPKTTSASMPASSAQTSGPPAKSQSSSAVHPSEQTTMGTNQTLNSSHTTISIHTAPSGKPNNTHVTTALSHTSEQELASSPGLVAVLCLFSIIVILVLLVVIMNAVQSRRSNFERLEDVPMEKVNEESPFAHLSK